MIPVMLHCRLWRSNLAWQYGDGCNRNIGFYEKKNIASHDFFDARVELADATIGQCGGPA